MSDNLKIYERVEPKDYLIFQDQSIQTFDEFILSNEECSFYEEVLNNYNNAITLSQSIDTVKNDYQEKLIPILETSILDLSSRFQKLSQDQNSLIDIINNIDVKTLSTGYGREQGQIFNNEKTIHITDWISSIDGQRYIEVNHGLGTFPEKVSLDIRLKRDIGDYEAGTVFLEFPIKSWHQPENTGIRDDFRHRLESSTSKTRLFFQDIYPFSVQMIKRKGEFIKLHWGKYGPLENYLWTYSYKNYPYNLVRHFDFEYRFRIYKYA